MASGGLNTTYKGLLHKMLACYLLRQPLYHYVIKKYCIDPKKAQLKKSGFEFKN